MDNNTLALLLLTTVETENSSRGIMLALKDKIADNPYYQVKSTKWRLTRTDGERLWKKGKCRVETAIFVAQALGDPELLGVMAKKETRQGVRIALAENPQTPLEDFFALDINEYNTWRKLSVSRIHQSPLDDQLRRLCAGRDAWGAWLTHPAQNGPSVLDALKDHPGVLDHLMRENLATAWPEVLTHLKTRILESPSNASGIIFRNIRSAITPQDLEMMVAKGRCLTLISEMRDLPSELCEELWVEADADSNWQVRQQSENLANQANLPLHLLRRVRLSQRVIPALSRALTLTLGDNLEAWEVAAGLLESFQGKTLGEITDTLHGLGYGSSLPDQKIPEKVPAGMLF